MNPPISDPEPSAGQSSASQCIQLSCCCHHSNNSNNNSNAFFHPVYTHQCFEKEYIPGYQPFPNPTNNNERSKNQMHSSLQSHIRASSHLRISINLAPSCQHCTLSIQTQLKQQKTHDQNTNNVTVVKSIPDDKKADADKPIVKKRKITFDMNTKEQPQNDAQTEITSMDKIIQSISQALPPIQHTTINGIEQPQTTVNKNATASNNIQEDYEYLKEPIGIPIDEYTYIRKNSNNQEESFVLSLASPTTTNCDNDNDVCKYHNQIQPLALWFIENASNINLSSDEGGGFWKVLYLFKKEKTHGNTSSNKNYIYSFVGYVTLFGFYSPFRKPKSGIILRICQVLILPPYQRCGHGTKLCQTVYNYIQGKYNDKIKEKKNEQEIVEVNVEDPSPAFEALRNVIDYDLFQKNYNAHYHNKDQEQEFLLLPNNYYEPNAFTTIKDNDAIVASTKAKISKTQIHVAYEIYKLKCKNTLLEQILKDRTNNDDDAYEKQKEDIEKKYRLMVKKRLNHYHAEDIGACSTKDEKKQKLAELYEETMIKYKKIVEN